MDNHCVRQLYYQADKCYKTSNTCQRTKKKNTKKCLIMKAIAMKYNKLHNKEYNY